MKRTITALVAVAAVASLAACSDDSTEDVGPTRTTTSSGLDSSDLSNDELAQIALGLTFYDLDEDQQENICWLYDFDPDRAWGAFSETAQSITRRQFDRFFDSAC